MPSLLMGNRVLNFSSLASTNDKLKALLSENDLPEGTLVKAYEQFAGKGYSTRTWESEPGKNLTVSYLLKPGFLPPQNQFKLTQVTSLAVRDTISYFYNGSKQIAVKWPNDIYVNQSKIAGILAENSIMGSQISHCIAGIGLNVNQEVFLSDAPNPVSLKLLTKKEISIDNCLEVLSLKLQHWYNKLKASDYKTLDEAYHKLLFRKDIPSQFYWAGETFTATLRGTDEYGQLILEDQQGKLQFFDFKEVEFVL